VPVQPTRPDAPPALLMRAGIGLQIELAAMGVSLRQDLQGGRRNLLGGMHA